MTVPSAGEAEKISNALLEERLIACANIMPPHNSLYWWEGKIQDGSEVAIIMKTQKALFESVKKRAVQLHSYDCPCIVALDITDGHQPFLKWIAAETANTL
ncbi:MAG: divalent-cation tolerance protein CutA [Alphaproteobacteria bacterium]